MTSENTEHFEQLSEEHQAFYQEHGYTNVCKIKGRVVGLMQFIFTCGIVVGLDEYGYSHRYCYPTPGHAAIALFDWIQDGTDEPADYIKRK